MYIHFLSQQLKRGFILMALAILCSNSIFAQSENVDQYFDDGGLTNTFLIAKADLFSITHGDLSVLAELRISSRLSFELGGGPMLFTSNSLLDELIEAAPDLFGMSNGWGWRTALRYYPFTEYMEGPLEGFFLGFQIRRRSYLYNSESRIALTDAPIIMGYQAFLGDHFILDMYTGGGFRAYSGYSMLSLAEPEPSVFFHIGLQAGYRF